MIYTLSIMFFLIIGFGGVIYMVRTSADMKDEK